MLLAFIRFRWVDNTSASDFSQMVFGNKETAKSARRQDMRLRIPRIGLEITAMILGDFGKFEMVRLGGLEPPTSGATNLRSNQLSYNRTSNAEPALRGVT